MEKDSPDSDSESLFSTSISSTSFRTTIGPGPGAVAGRAIYRLGEMTLKGVEQVIIYRRLSSISSHFPHRNSLGIRGLEQMYLDLLELSRPHLYSNTIRDRALRLLLAQVGSMQIQHLIRALRRWPCVEVQLLLSDIVGRFNPVMTNFISRGRYLKDPVVKAYRDNVSQEDDEHSLTPLVEFLVQVALIDTERRSAVLEGGALDFLTNAYLTDFHEPMVPFDEDVSHKSPLLGAGNSLLMATFEGGMGSYIMNHPLSYLWPLQPALYFFPNDFESRRSKRARWWSTITSDAIKWRIASIIKTITDTSRTIGSPDMLDLVIDCFELIGANLPDELSFKALRCLHIVVLRRVDVIMIKGAIYHYLADTPEKHTINVLERIVRMLFRLLAGEESAVKHFTFSVERSFIWDAVAHLINWMIVISQRQPRWHDLVVATSLIDLAKRTLILLNEQNLNRKANGHPLADVSIHDLLYESSKEADYTFYAKSYPDSIHAPCQIHVLRYGLLLLEDYSPDRTLLSLPDTSWSRRADDAEPTMDVVYSWIEKI